MNPQLSQFGSAPSSEQLVLRWWVVGMGMDEGNGSCSTPGAAPWIPGWEEVRSCPVLIFFFPLNNSGYQLGLGDALPILNGFGEITRFNKSNL